MEVFFVVTIGRQVEGDAINIKFEKAFKTNEAAFAYADKLSKTCVEMVKMPDADGKVYNIQFACQRSVFQLEIEE